MKPPEVPRGSKPFNRIDFTLFVILVLGTFALYIRTAGFEFLGFDDPMYVSNNWHVHTGLSWDNLRWALTDTSTSNWHPLTTLGYLTLSTLFGTKPIGFHLANAFLHSIDVGLFYIFLRQTTWLPWQSAIAAALWGWHPQRVESVAWVSELKDVLCGFFCLVCMLAYVHYTRRRGVGRYVLVVVLFVCALMSKPLAVTLPAVFLLLDYWPLGVRWNRWWLIEQIPLVLLSLAASIACIFTQTDRGSAGSLQMFPMPVRFENALVSYCAYIAKTFLPTGLSVFYPHPATIGENIPAIKWIGAAALLIIITAAVVWQARIRPYLVVGWFWFLGTMLPMIGLVQVGGQAMADRYSYIPSIGLVIAAVWLVSDGVMPNRPARRIALVFGIACSVAMVISTCIQLGYWRNNQTLFSHADAVTEKNYLARATLAYAYFETPGWQSKAMDYARSAVEVCPSLPYPHHALAAVYQEQQLDHKAFAEYEVAIRLDPFDARTYGDFGALLVKMGRDEDAINQFRHALKLDPTIVETRHNLAICLANHNQLDEAISQWQTALHYAPSDGLIHGWLAEALRMRGDNAGAIKQYRAAEAAGEHNQTWETNFAWLLATDPGSTPNDLDQAVSIARKVCEKTDYKNIGALDSLAAALARTGRFDDAVAAASKAVALAEAQHQPKLAADIKVRLDAYRHGHPYMIANATTRPLP